MAPPATPFFLDAGPGQRYCLFHAPRGACRGALLYLHPFAEEMNKSRRMAALQARALAAQGYGVLQIDLHGCGDSDGDFAEARWDGWKQDVAAGSNWLREKLGVPVGLWGLRLGALLALDYARQAAHPVERLLLWQPVHAGSAFLTQFLRLRLASDMLGEDGKDQGGTRALRAALARGEPLEIAGYVLSPELAQAIDALDAAAMAPPCPVDWFEMVAAEGRPLPPAAARITAGWPACGTHLVAGPQFWSTQEIAEAPALLAATCGACR